jgi:hypothetical protein
MPPPKSYQGGRTLRDGRPPSDPTLGQHGTESKLRTRFASVGLVVCVHTIPEGAFG